MQSLVLGSRLLRSSPCYSPGGCMGPVRHMCMRRILRELAAEDDSHEFKVSKIEASSIHLDQSLRMRDEMERSRSRRKNPPVSLANIAMIAAAAGIATALCRELQEERRSWQRPQGRLAPADQDSQYALEPHPLKVKLEYVMSRQEDLQEELKRLGTLPNTRSTARRKKEIAQELKEFSVQQAQLMEDAKQLLLRRD